MHHFCGTTRLGTKMYPLSAHKHVPVLITELRSGAPTDLFCAALISRPEFTQEFGLHSEVHSRCFHVPLSTIRGSL